MARYRFEPQACVQVSTAAITDPRLRRGSALAVYVLGVSVRRIDVEEMAEILQLTKPTVDSTLAYLRATGWALDLGDDHLLLDYPVEVGRNGSIKETPYAMACIRFALGLTEVGSFVSSPEERRSTFRVITSSDGGKMIT